MSLNKINKVFVYAVILVLFSCSSYIKYSLAKDNDSNSSVPVSDTQNTAESQPDDSTVDSETSENNDPSAPVSDTQNETETQDDSPLLDSEQMGASSLLSEDSEITTSSTPPHVIPNVLDATGALSYSIPIKVPPGRKNLTPNLSLKYNSYDMKKNGWVGVSWTLDMGYIERSAKRGVNYNAFDFVVNGNELLPENIDSNGNGQYRAKIEGAFTRYNFTHTDGWEVITKEGQKFYYGSDNNSRQDNSENSSQVFKWYLNRVEDSNGNTILIDYFKDQGQIYLDEINYTNNTIKLYYETGRSDTEVSYKTNFKVTTDRLLKTIDIMGNGLRARVYSFSYQQSNSTFRSLLSTVEEYDCNTSLDSVGNIISGSGTALPQLSFTYQESGMEYTNETWTSQDIDTNAASGSHWVDLNGDEKTDYVTAHSNSGHYVSLSTGDGFEEQGWGGNYANLNSDSLWVDLNGDDKADYVRNNGEFGFYVSLSTGTGFVEEQWENPANALSSTHWLDANGDGKTDCITINGEGADYLYLSTGTRLEWDRSFEFSILNTDCHWIDLNGDGLTDYVTETGVMDEYYQFVGLSTGSGYSSNIWTDLGTMQSGGQWADLNGDGKADHVTINGDDHSVHLSTGSGYADNETWPGYGVEASGSHWVDLNGDGKADYVTTNGNTHYISFSTGTGYVNQTWTGQGSSTSDGRWVDLNGDGLTDYVSTDGTEHSVSLNSGPFPDLLSSISVENAGSSSIEYTNSSEIENILLPIILHPVSSIKTNDGLGNETTVSLDYSGGLFDYTDREFLGFKSVTQTNNNGTTQKTVFYQGVLESDDPEDAGDNEYLKGRVNYIENRESAGGNLISRTDMTYGQQDEGSGIEFVYLDFKVNQTYENGQMVIETYEDPISYDAEGNLENVELWDSQGSAEKITKAFEYTNYGTASDPLWRLTMESVAGDLSGDVRKTWYRYTSDGHANLWQKEFWNNQGTNPVVTYEYDAYGNVETERDARSNPTSYVYDSQTNTYPVRVTNALGHVIEMGWDYRFGRETWTMDANSIRTDFEYDQFGRSIQMNVTDPGSNLVARTVTEYHLDASPRYIKRRVLESQSPASYIDTYQYVDGLGRTIQTISMGIRQGKLTPVVMRTFYDNMGRACESWGPYFGSGISYPSDPLDGDVPEVSIMFDLRSRPEKIQTTDSQHAGGATVQYSYNGLSTTITDPDGSQKQVIKDYMGRTVEIVAYTESGDLHTQYDYNAAGDLQRVEDTLQNVTLINYDTLGRKINMTDPDMGFWEYAYDANGNLIRQVDAKQQVIEFDYDALNRVELKQYMTPGPNDHNVMYTYDDQTLTSQYPIGRLSQVNNSVSQTTYKQYNALGNVHEISEEIDGASPVVTTYHFDMAGRPSRTVYPGNYQVGYYYFPGTSLMQNVMGVSDFTGFVTYSDFTAGGKIKMAESGNGVETSYDYDPLSTRLTGIQTQHDTHGQFMDRTYYYTKAGDVEIINDGISGHIRFYEYDKLHRLTREYNSGDDYSDLKHQELGYTYALNKPLHGPAQISDLAGSYTFDYDANGNMISGADFSDPDNPATRTITYNGDNMPVQINHSVHGTTTFLYNGSSSRIKKSGPNGDTYYYGDHFEIQNGAEVKYIFAGSQRIAMIKNGQTLYFHKDHLGSTSILTDASGAAVQQGDYLPFGGQRGESTISASNYGFTDQEKDPEVGLLNYNARLYDPAIGIFITADTIVPNPFDSQSLNRYAYCLNNPVKYIDPTGHFEDYGDGNGDTNMGNLESNALGSWSDGTGRSGNGGGIISRTWDALKKGGKEVVAICNMAMAKGVEDISRLNFSQIANNLKSIFDRGDIFGYVELDAVPLLGFEGALGIVFDFDNPWDSGLFGTIPVAAVRGGNFGVGTGVGFARRDIEGVSWNLDANLETFSPTIGFDDEGWNSFSFSLGPGLGASGSLTNTGTLTVEDFARTYSNGGYHPFSQY